MNFHLGFCNEILGEKCAEEMIILQMNTLLNISSSLGIVGKVKEKKGGEQSEVSTHLFVGSSCRGQKHV